jgi:hypothetical protein
MACFCYRFGNAFAIRFAIRFAIGLPSRLGSSRANLASNGANPLGSLVFLFAPILMPYNTLQLKEASKDNTLGPLPLARFAPANAS